MIGCGIDGVGEDKTCKIIDNLSLLGVNSPEVSDKEKVIFKSFIDQAGLDLTTKVQFKVEVNVLYRLIKCISQLNV